MPMGLLPELASRLLLAQRRTRKMTIGGGVFLVAVGAILAFAVNFQLAGIDINIVGWILMAAGVFGVITGLYLMNRGRRTDLVEERVVVRDPRL